MIPVGGRGQRQRSGQMQGSRSGIGSDRSLTLTKITRVNEQKRIYRAVVSSKGGHPSGREVGAAFHGIPSVTSDTARPLVIEVRFVDRARFPVANGR